MTRLVGRAVLGRCRYSGVPFGHPDTNRGWGLIPVRRLPGGGGDDGAESAAVVFAAVVVFVVFVAACRKSM